MSSLPEKYISIDEEGFPRFGELRVTDEEVGGALLAHITYAENGALETEVAGERSFVEAFDEPFVAQQVHRKNSKWWIQLPYQVQFEFDPHSLSLDEWDRFHGLTLGKDIPFVLSRKAQAEFFNLLDDYDDEHIVIDMEKIKVPPWFSSTEPVETEQFWTHIYQSETPRWELNQPTPPLVEMLPRLKLPKCRVLVLGCGSGNDAAFFASAGHLVTAVDISPEAITRGKEKYGLLANLTFVQSDLFALGHEYDGQYDLIFEHTCYCAIQPSRRADLIKLWQRLLTPQGQLLGVFFCMEKRDRPPFGGSEWELRERLKKEFQFLFWSRWRKSIDRRNGKELVILAQRKS